MSDPFLLCDPGLLLPPNDDTVERYQEFWHRLLAWSADRRLRLGVNGREAVLRILTLNGWPQYDPPHCPDSLSREARRALGELLASIATDEAESVAQIPDLEPSYVKHPECGMALAIDIAEQHANSMVGAASHPEHWEYSSDSVTLRPPPPVEMPLAFEPHAISEREKEARVAMRLQQARVLVVGGKQSVEVVTNLEGRFDLPVDQITWIEVEPHKHPNVKRLMGARPGRDVIVCITGKIGHAESEKVVSIARSRGIDPLLVEKASEIAEGLVSRFA
jgi:hypothetical protein